MKKTLLTLIAFLLSLNAFSQIPNYVPQNGLVGWWPFNGNANDESGNGNNGTVNGATLATDRFGNANQAYSFDGVNDYISIATINQLGLSNSSFSISIWVRCSVFGQNNDEDYIIGTPMWGGGSDEGVKIQNNPQGNPYGVYSSSLGIGGQIYCASNNNFSLHSWESIVVRYNNLTGLFQMYINGNLMSSSTLIGSPLTNPYPISVGAFVGPWISGFLSGKTDDIGIWNRTLTECEIQDLYQAQLNSLSQSISAGGDQSICAGDNVTLSGSGGSNYQWNNNVVDGQAFAPTQSNSYVLTAQDSLGCTGIDTVVVTVLENSASTLSETSLDSYTLNGQTYTQSGTYTQTLTAANGCDSTITLNLTLNFTGIDELGTNAKKLVNITDLNGKTIPRRKNTLMLFIFEDGTVERVVEMEE
jgi:hypothetical protein